MLLKMSKGHIGCYLDEFEPKEPRIPSISFSHFHSHIQIGPKHIF
jgi:hypothetical protein